MKQRVTIGVLWLVAGGASCIGHPSPAPQPEWGVALLEVGSSRDAQQEQTALRDCLELLGIPYVATSDVVQAAHRPLIFAGGILTNTQLTPSQRETLYSYVERGGVLLSTQVQGNKFFPLFGIAEAATSRTNFRLLFTGSDDPVLRYLNRPDERDISLGDPTLYSETVWSTEYTPSPGTQVLARYANGKAALTVNTYGRGLAYALGLGFKETTLIPRLARGFEAARHWINWFEPSGDVFRLLLRGLYEDNVHPFVLVHTVPEGRDSALCLSHDVDAQVSFRNSIAFARMEASLGVRSTFFVTTKYFRDAADIGYYMPENTAWVRQLKELGFEIASHSVSHSFSFDNFPVGSFEVTPASYDPSHPTIVGEVRVSKQLLDRDLHQQTVGFRAGYLRFPNELLRVLEECGYVFDSSVSAQWVLTNFPYFGFRQRTLGSEHARIVVVPVNLDDSRGELETRDFLRPGNQEEALHVWAEVITANAENNATNCLLIHPTDTTYKLETERRLIDSIRGHNIWIGDVGSLVRFWVGRSRLQPTVRGESDGRISIVLNLKRSDLPSGQVLALEARPGTPVPNILDATGEPIPFQSRLTNDRILLQLP